MKVKPAHDPILEAEVERAMQPYKKLLPPKMQAIFRENLVRALTQDPKGKALLDRVRPAPLVAESGEALKDGAVAPDSERAAASGVLPRGGGGGDERGGPR